MTLFELLAADPRAGLTVAEIGRRLGVDKATCYPMLTALHDAGYLVRHPARRTYHLGPALVPIGRAAAVGLPAPDLVHAAITDLARSLRLTCAAVAPADDHVVVVDEAWASHQPTPALVIGQRLPLRPPWGAVFVAWADDTRVDRWLAQAPGESVDAARWREVLAGVRNLGGVVEVNELPPDDVRARVASLPADASRAELHAFVERLVDHLSRQAEPVLTMVAPAQRYHVTSINVPVRDVHGDVVLAIAAMGFRDALAGEEVSAVLAHLAAATARLRVA
jgi:DNA-binding IclR family transcriptional regulator